MHTNKLIQPAVATEKRPSHSS
uniref:Uncharacterized protein n=1 Tax=Anguilla anguilla TaxID=7936 RepID=A0A0E9U1R7_ANGAN